MENKVIDPKLGKLKTAFLYVLIGGLVVSALISVTAILIGEFNEAVAKALFTTFIVMTHSLLILTLVSADRHNTIGKSILPTTLFVVTVANMITSTLGTWSVWDGAISLHAFYTYILITGVAFAITGALKLRIPHKPTAASVYTTIALTALLACVLLPWVVASDTTWLGVFYYRLTAAITILAATAYALSVILNRIALSGNPALKSAVLHSHSKLSTGLLVIYILVGIFVSFVWLIGVVAFIGNSYDASARVDANRYNSTHLDKTHYNTYD